MSEEAKTLAKKVEIRVHMEDNLIIDLALEDCYVWFAEDILFSNVNKDGTRDPLMQRIRLDAVKDITNSES